jgi:hypothetical protein
MFSKPNKDELVVFVSVNTESLKEFSKFILSKTKTLERIKILMKKLIKIKKDKFTICMSIFLSEKKILLLKTLFGRTNFNISLEAVFNKI